MKDTNYPPSSCPFHVTSFKECKEKSITEDWPNGKPGSWGGVYERATHPCVNTVHCFCKYAFIETIKEIFTS